MPTDERAPDQVIGALGSSNPEKRLAAVRRAAALGLPDPLLSAVAALAGDADTRVRAAVAESLTGNSDPRAVAALAELLEDDTRQVTWAAEDAMWVLPELRERLALAISQMLAQDPSMRPGGYTRFRQDGAPEAESEQCSGRAE